MPPQSTIAATVEHTIQAFCLDFLVEPYLCYTEHGLHALFYTKLYNALRPDQRYTIWNSRKVCVLQKEYPTAGSLSKPRRQHWDVAVIATPPHNSANKEPAYDYLRLAAVIEFGLNEAKAHLQDDIERISHPEANLDNGYVVHLYRLSGAEHRFSGRDWPSESAQICPKGQVAELVANKSVTVYYGVWDGSGKYEPGLWRVDCSGVAKVR